MVVTLAKAVLLAKDMGIKVWAADESAQKMPQEIVEKVRFAEKFVRTKQAFIQDFIARNRDIVAAAETAKDADRVREIAARANAEFEDKYPGLERENELANQAITRYRSDESALKKFIRDRAGNERALVVYGADHFASKIATRIGSLLKQFGTVFFNVYDDDQGAFEYLSMVCRDPETAVPKRCYFHATNSVERVSCD